MRRAVETKYPPAAVPFVSGDHRILVGELGSESHFINRLHRATNRVPSALE